MERELYCLQYNLQWHKYTYTHMSTFHFMPNMFTLHTHEEGEGKEGSGSRTSAQQQHTKKWLLSGNIWCCYLNKKYMSVCEFANSCSLVCCFCCLLSIHYALTSSNAASSSIYSSYNKNIFTKEKKERKKSSITIFISCCHAIAIVRRKHKALTW